MERGIELSIDDPIGGEQSSLFQLVVVAKKQSRARRLAASNDGFD